MRHGFVEDGNTELSPQQRSYQLLQTFRQAALQYFTQPVKQLYARRLWAMAEFFERTGRENSAQTARAEARRLFHDAPGVPSRFAEFLFEKVLLLTAMQEATRAGAEAMPGGRERPGAAERASAPGEKKSPGGLILP